MTTSRYDAKEDAPYGTCIDCGTELATQQLAREHMDSTFEDVRTRVNNGGHSVRITNPTRPDRVENAVASAVEDGMRDASEELERLIAAGDLTRAEVTDALRQVEEFSDYWSEQGFAATDDAVTAASSAA